MGTYTGDFKLLLWSDGHILEDQDAVLITSEWQVH